MGHPVYQQNHTKQYQTIPNHTISPVSIYAILIHNATLLSCYFRKIATVSHFRLVCPGNAMSVVLQCTIVYYTVQWQVLSMCSPSKNILWWCLSMTTSYSTLVTSCSVYFSISSAKLALLKAFDIANVAFSEQCIEIVHKKIKISLMSWNQNGSRMEKNNWSHEKLS